MAGKLVLVVGPSGAGKDSLLTAAAERLAEDRRFVFPRRMITRAPDGITENHIPISRAEFDELVANNDVMLAWEAHGLGYVIPRDVKRLVATGKIAVCNGSRHVVARLRTTIPDSAVVLIAASPRVCAWRLATRGREPLDDIAERLARDVVDLPANTVAATIENSGPLAESVDAFCTSLMKLASRTAQESAGP